jgi:hypothetical protein
MNARLQALLPFDGTREVGDFTLDLFDGRATLSCTVSERWDDLMVKTIKCGDTFKRSLSRRIGVSKAEKDDLESVVKGSLGVSGLASLESGISSKRGVETRFEVVDEVQEEVSFAAPECGIRIIRLQQLQRMFRMTFRDSRAFKKDWQKAFSERVDRVHDGGSVDKPHPDCGCEPKTRDPSDGTFIVDMGRLTLRAAFHERDGFLYFPDLGARIPSYAARLEYVTVGLKPGMVPRHLLFLAALTDEYVVTRFVPENVPAHVGQVVMATSESEADIESDAEAESPM